MTPAPDYAERLRAADLRVTRPRLAVLEAVYGHPHADTESIFGAVRADLHEPQTLSMLGLGETRQVPKVSFGS